MSAGHPQKRTLLRARFRKRCLLYWKRPLRCFPKMRLQVCGGFVGEGLGLGCLFVGRGFGVGGLFLGRGIRGLGGGSGRGSSRLFCFVCCRGFCFVVLVVGDVVFVHVRHTTRGCFGVSFRCPRHQNIFTDSWTLPLRLWRLRRSARCEGQAVPGRVAGVCLPANRANIPVCMRGSSAVPLFFGLLAN